jgi:ech hydrogenase subunit A
VLAYSTVANLGLIVACAGAAHPAAIWAATMLIIFHAVTKSLLFLCVGTAEHNIGSRDIEDMDGLFGKLPRLATFMVIGISAMFLAPFGMLISKWAALEGVINSGNPFLVLFIIFGSSVTLFYWGKWLGKLVAIVAKRENIQDRVHGEEWAPLGTLVALVVAACIMFPVYSNALIVPYVVDVFSGADPMRIIAMLMNSDDLIIMAVLVAFIVLLPLLFYGKTQKKIVPIYLSGAGLGDNLRYMGSMQKETEFKLRNWYMEDYFNEKRMNLIGIIATCVVFVVIAAVLIGLLMGGAFA